MARPPGPLTDAHKAAISASLMRPIPTEKKCCMCKLIKPAAEFSMRSKNPRNLRGECKECGREASRRWGRSNPERVAASNRAGSIRRMGLDVAEYDRMLALQDGRCAICRRLPDGKRLFIDHDHDSGVIRGLLCSHCNTGLGMFFDDISVLERAASYLGKQS